MIAFIKKNILLLFGITYSLRVFLIGVIYKNLDESNISLIKISLINVFNFIFIVYVLDKKNLEQLILYKIFSLFLVIKTIYTVSLMSKSIRITPWTKFFVGVYLLFILLDIIIARIAWNALYYEFMRSLTNNIGFSLYRKKLYDIKQNIKVGMSLYFINLVLEEYYFFLKGISMKCSIWFLLYNLYRFSFVVFLFIFCLKTSLRFRFFSICFIIMNLIGQTFILILQARSKYRMYFHKSNISDIILDGYDNLFILLYMLYYSIQHLIYTRHISDLFYARANEHN